MLASSAAVKMLAKPGKRMRIAVVTETYPPEINGVALTVQNFVEQLSTLGQEVLLTRPRQPAAESPALVQLLREANAPAARAA